MAGMRRKRHPRESILRAVEELGYEAAEAVAMKRPRVAAEHYADMKKLLERGEERYGREFRLEMQKRALLGTRKGRLEHAQYVSSARRRRANDARSKKTRTIPLKALNSALEE